MTFFKLRMNRDSEVSRHKVSLEDILRLKRIERPLVEFWEDFDRKLRRRTLQALVSEDPRPRSRFRSLFFRLAVAIPVAAAAGAALIFVVFQSGTKVEERVPVDLNIARAETVKPIIGPRLVESRRSQNYTVFVAPHLQKTFVIEVIEVPQDKELSYQKNLKPRTFTALSSLAESRISADPQEIAPRDVRFVSAPSLQYF